jgi:quinoprotein relay system zinc metallohydrolase 2
MFAARLLCSLLCLGGAGWALAQSALAVQALAPGVYVHQGRVEDWGPENGGDVANLGFIVGERCVAVIDTGGTPALGTALRVAIQRVTPLPVCYVINTHVHPDHLLGNQAFVGAAQFVGNARLAAALSARERFLRNALQRDFGITLAEGGIVYPTVGVEQRLEIDLGRRVLQLQAWPTSHTNNDLTVFDVATRTLFLSDLLFVEHIPVLDGNLKGWLKTLGELRTLDVALAVPGHGTPSRNWPAVLDAEQRYLQALLDETRAALRGKSTIQQAVEQVGREAAAPWQLADRFHRRNVTAAYAELEWED